MSSQPTTIRWEQDDTGVVTLVLDDPTQPVNTMNAAFRASLTAVADRLEAERDTVRGVIVTSAKRTFFAGGDLRDLSRITPEQAPRAFEAGMAVKRALRRIETLGKPVVAALNGSALGGGLEIALACHHRVALDAPGARFGFPEVQLGLLPGGGGVVRSVRLLGIADALLKLLIKGKQYAPARAREIGVVDEVVSTPDELLARARAFVEAHPTSEQPWDGEGYRVPGGTPASPRLAASLPAFPATLRKQLGGAPYPAPRNILAAAVESAQVDFATAQEVEARYFTELVTGQTAKNMIQGFFFDMRRVNSGARRPGGFPPRQVRRVAVLGAGMMGAGIAYACARAGIEVVLRDVSLEAAERGKAHSARLLEKALAAGRTTERERDALLARITPAAEAAAVAGCDVVIEAVYEDHTLKQKVFQEVEPLLAPDALLCSNTSTLPVSRLAEGVERRRDFLGLHFFSPVDRMRLVEIVRGEETSDEALARAFDLVRQLRKTPIQVNDSRGFFTSRVIGQFLNEGVGMLAEGVAPATIEQAAAQAGYPARLLSLMDDLTLTLPRRIRQESRREVEEGGGTWQPHPAEEIIDRMIDEFDRPGRGAGAGFYEYDADGRRLGLWPGLREHFGREDVDPAAVSLRELTERLLFVEALETVRCLEEGVLTSVADANVGSLLGIGFPGWTGGALQYVNGYPGGVAGFTARARELADTYGPRFAPPGLLVALAERGEPFADPDPDAADPVAAPDAR